MTTIRVEGPNSLRVARSTGTGRLFAALTAGLALAGCVTQLAGPPKDLHRPPPAAASAPAASGTFAAMEAAIANAHGPTQSGFTIIDRNENALRLRLALIDSAKSSLDLQYYVWFGDDLGTMMMKRVMDAADRGVRVRILIDDLNSLMRDAGTVEVRDDLLAMIDAHPNIELRVFNPWTQRDLAGRIGEAVTDTARMNQRMHNKQVIADNRAVIMGGRNLGDEYFGLSEDFNFHDLDVLGIGPVARQASAVFDLFWNSPWLLAIGDLDLKYSREQATQAYEQMVAEVAASHSLSGFPAVPQDWTDKWREVAAQLAYGESTVHTDVPTDDGIRQEMIEVIFGLGASAQKELTIENAYIIPNDRFIEGLKTLKARGVQTRMITNSLASHDVPAVNSHYKKWRKPLIESTDGLYEMRHDAAIKPVVADTPPTVSKFMGLHSKGMVVDRERVYIGSMNFDPRSANINTEMGVLIVSPELGQRLAALFERDMRPENTWHVELTPRGSIIWVDDKETVTRQPARNFWQRVEDVFFMAFPSDLY